MSRTIKDDTKRKVTKRELRKAMEKARVQVAELVQSERRGSNMTGIMQMVLR